MTGCDPNNVADTGMGWLLVVIDLEFFEAYGDITTK